MPYTTAAYIFAMFQRAVITPSVREDNHFLPMGFVLLIGFFSLFLLLVFFISLRNLIGLYQQYTGQSKVHVSRNSSRNVFMLLTGVISLFTLFTDFYCMVPIGFLFICATYWLIYSRIKAGKPSKD